MDAAEATGLKYSLNSGDGAFYGPKLDFVLRDAIGRDWQCGTLQVDLNLPSRLGASYVASDGSKKIPVMLHRALFGSLERFIGILIGHYAGKLPLWLAPLQIVVLPITSEFDNYAKKIFEQCMKAGINVEVDLKNQKINYKIREYSLSKVPLLLICGDKEVKAKSVTIRKLGSEKQETLSLDQAIKKISQKTKFPTN
jgi:threonyl-tRNA synthetase